LTSATDRIVDVLAKRLPVPRETLQAQVTAGMKTGARYLVGVTQGIIVSTTSILVTTVFATIFLFYLLRYGEVGWPTRRVCFLLAMMPRPI
jgi:predicted PurR-regulated permease PerM